MIAPLRVDADQSNPLFTEPRRIGDLLPQLLAERGIKLPQERLDRRQVETSLEFDDPAKK